jgi:putative flippase GtrA
VIDLEEVKKNQAVRFLTVGSITFLCEYIVFYVLYIFVHWNLLLANSLSFIVGLSISFMLNRIWAFKEDNYQRKFHHQALIYIVLALSNLVINNLIVSGLKAAGLDPRIGKIIAIATIAVWNFMVYKYIIFKSVRTS